MKMDFYQKRASEFAVYPRAHALPYVALGLTGEAGELANKVKKILRGDPGAVNAEALDAMIRELGDVLWYVAAMATELGVTLEDVALLNLAKLGGRLEGGTIRGSGDER